MVALEAESTTAVPDGVHLGHPVFDCDNHYYEALDAFTRHVDPKMQRRLVEWCEIGGRKYHVIGGKVSHAVTNPTFDPVAKAGALHDYFRGNPDEKLPMEFLQEREPIPAAYRGRDARLERMDAFGLEKIWLFPTLGVLYEELLKDDVEGVQILFNAFNRYLEDDWGYAYQDRIFTAPYIALGDVSAACVELDRVLAAGAQLIVIRPAPVLTPLGYRSPADAEFDPFWARAAEAGVTVVVHAADSGYSSNGYAEDGFGASFSGGSYKPSIKSFNIERAAHDWLITVTMEKLFDRFPNLRIASVENGSDFLAPMFRKLDQTAKKMPGWFAEHPVESFKRNVWMNPFWEDTVEEVVELMGADRVIFGSDWPHIEGMPRPLDYLPELDRLTDADRKLVLYDNTLSLTVPRPA